MIKISCVDFKRNLNFVADEKDITQSFSQSYRERRDPGTPAYLCHYKSKIENRETSILNRNLYSKIKEKLCFRIE